MKTVTRHEKLEDDLSGRHFFLSLSSVLLGFRAHSRIFASNCSGVHFQLGFTVFDIIHHHIYRLNWIKKIKKQFVTLWTSYSIRMKIIVLSYLFLVLSVIKITIFTILLFRFHTVDKNSSALIIYSVCLYLWRQVQRWPMSVWIIKYFP